MRFFLPAVSPRRFKFFCRNAGWVGTGGMLPGDGEGTVRQALPNGGHTLIAILWAPPVEMGQGMRTTQKRILASLAVGLALILLLVAALVVLHLSGPATEPPVDSGSGVEPQASMREQPVTPNVSKQAASGTAKDLDDPLRGQDVSEELAKKAALYEAEALYGKTSVFSVTTLYSIAGKPEAYCFVLHRKNGTIPSADEMASSVGDARRQVAERRGASKDISDRAKLAQALDEVGAFEKANVWRTAEFTTVICGAHEGNVPVIRMTEGLPPQTVLLGSVREQLADKYGKENVRFARPIYGDQFSTLLEFEVGKKRVLVDPLSGREMEKGLLIKRETAKLEEKRRKLGTDFAVREGLRRRRILMKKKWDFVRAIK